ncbi:MAG: hypothetical protein ACRC1K_23420 [Planctomycetia bacterium]
MTIVPPRSAGSSPSISNAAFFLDLPGRAEKDAIWEIHLAGYDLDRSQRKPDDADWTGAEVKACCRLAALLDLPLVEAARNVVPVAKTAAESVDRLRTWASGRCLSADRPGLFQHGGVNQIGGPRRRVNRDPSAN